MNLHRKMITKFELFKFYPVKYCFEGITFVFGCSQNTMRLTLKFFIQLRNKKYCFNSDYNWRHFWSWDVVKLKVFVL